MSNSNELQQGVLFFTHLYTLRSWISALWPGPFVSNSFKGQVGCFSAFFFPSATAVIKVCAELAVMLYISK